MGFEFSKHAKDIEEAREDFRGHSPVSSLFRGDLTRALLNPFPNQAKDDREVGNEYLQKVERFLRAHVDVERIERKAVIDNDTIEKAMELGLFRMKIPKKYGGLGLSVTNYNRVLALVAEHCYILGLMLSVHQSIGVSEPLLLCIRNDTYTQKQRRLYEKYLREIVDQNMVTGFALTEPGAGSDASRVATKAIYNDKDSYYLQGEKLYITNSTVADRLMVVARAGQEGKHTAFLLDMNLPGIEMTPLSFMGCRGIENAHITFKNVRVPEECMIGNVGDGLKIALKTLNTGRISIASLRLGAVRAHYKTIIDWCNQRMQFGKPIGEFELNAHKLERIGRDLFAAEAMIYASCALASNKSFDPRVEAAMCKLFTTERLWQRLDDMVQIRGGRGYETATSQKSRGEEIVINLEQAMRDARLDRIGEGSDETMRLFISREVYANHIKRAQPFFDPETSFGDKLQCFFSLAAHYVPWYLGQLIPRGKLLPKKIAQSPFREHFHYFERASRKLARMSFYAMVRFGPSLESRQAVLTRFTNIGMYMFVAMTAASYTLDDDAPQVAKSHAFELCEEAKKESGRLFKEIRRELLSFKETTDEHRSRVGKNILEGNFYPARR